MQERAASENASLLAVTRQGAVALVVLDAPRNRNALSRALIAELRAALAAIASDKTCKCVVLAAEGPAFSSGHDLKEMTALRGDDDGGKAAFDALFAECSRLMQEIIALPQPVIAAVEGIATAAGCQLVASCDLAIAGADARFATPGVQIGLFCSTPAVALSRAVGRKAAMQMLLTAELIPAEEAARIGLVNQVVTAGDARKAVLALAHRIGKASRHTLSLGKAAFYRQIDMPLAAAYQDASRTMADNMLSHDAREGIDAFLMKRPPVWEND